MPEAIKPSPNDPNFTRNLAKWIQIQNACRDIEKQAAITQEEMSPTKKDPPQKPGSTISGFGLFADTVNPLRHEPNIRQPLNEEIADLTANESVKKRIKIKRLVNKTTSARRPPSPNAKFITQRVLTCSQGVFPGHINIFSASKFDPAKDEYQTSTSQDSSPDKFDQNSLDIQSKDLGKTLQGTENSPGQSKKDRKKSRNDSFIQNMSPNKSAKKLSIGPSSFFRGGQ
jgi:hypothetical protein